MEIGASVIFFIYIVINCNISFLFMSNVVVDIFFYMDLISG